MSFEQPSPQESLPAKSRFEGPFTPEVEDELFFDWGIGRDFLNLLAAFREQADLESSEFQARILTELRRIVDQQVADALEEQAISSGSPGDSDYGAQDQTNDSIAQSTFELLRSFEQWRREP